MVTDEQKQATQKAVGEIIRTDARALIDRAQQLGPMAYAHPFDLVAHAAHVLLEFAGQQLPADAELSDDHKRVHGACVAALEAFQRKLHNISVTPIPANVVSLMTGRASG